MNVDDKAYAFRMLLAAHSNPSNAEFEGAAEEVSNMLKGGDIKASFERGQWHYRDGFDGELIYCCHYSIFPH